MSDRRYLESESLYKAMWDNFYKEEDKWQSTSEANFLDAHGGCPRHWFQLGFSAGLDAVVKAEPVNVKPKVQGKWLIDDYDIKNCTTVTREATDEDTALMYCSECHGHAGLNGHEDYVPSKYCPNCGADMEEKG